MNGKTKTKNSGLDKEAGTKVRVLVNMLEKASNFSQHIDTQTNILLGISVAIFTFSATQFKSANGSLFLFILGSFAAITALISLYAIHPPKMMRKRGQKESLLYNKKIVHFESEEKYCRAIEKVLTDENAIIKEYSSEIYNIYKYYYRPKRKLFKLARNVLILGIFFSLMVFLGKFIIN